MDDGARNRHALLLAAGEFGRRMVFAAFKAHGPECGGGALFSLAAAHATIDERQFDILEGGGARQEIEPWKTKPR